MLDLPTSYLCLATLHKYPQGVLWGYMRTEIKARTKRRLKIVEGQVRGLQKMVDSETYCIDIITQAQAIKNALSAVEGLMLKNHLETHVVEQMRGKNQKKATEEILKVYKLSQRK